MSSICPRPDCGEQVPPHLRNCVVCGFDAGAPNVRLANSPLETRALQERFREALAAAVAHGAREVAGRLETAAAASVAVWCVSPSKLSRLVETDLAIQSSFTRELAGDLRLPEDNEFDSARESAESAVHPNFHGEIQYAALSLTGIGASGYGSASVQLKSSSIADRSTVFEGPLFAFLARIRHVTGTPIPPGHRATWSSRAMLTIAKLGSTLKPGQTDEDLATMILDPSGARLAECIEVHIYGPLHRRAIDRIRITATLSKFDKALMRGVKSKLKPLGIAVDLPR